MTGTLISLGEVLSWLNQFNISHINPAMTEPLAQLGDTSISNTGFLWVKQRTLQSVTALDPMERPEVLLKAAEVEYGRGLLDESRNSVKEALKLYPDRPTNRHRRAVILWALGILEYKAIENMTAYSCWQAARLAFQTLADEYTTARAMEKAAWYQDKLKSMNLEMALTAEEAYTWLNVFPPVLGKGIGLRSAAASPPRAGESLPVHGKTQPLPLRPPAARLGPEQPVYVIVDKVNDWAQKHHYASARRFMEQLRFLAERTPDHTERPEIWLECGLAAHQMDMQEEAVDLLRHAAAMYGPRTHQQAVTHWMTGVVLWRVETRRHEIIPYWNQAIEIFRDLEVRADRRDRQDQRRWYHRILEILPAAMETRASQL